MANASGKKMIDALNGKAHEAPPIWLMRQAGRYLPEYRQLRATVPGFFDLVYNPDLATEVTMQPIRRFGMDGAILFSDILVIPQALGQTVEFIEAKGPVLEPVRRGDDLRRLNREKFDAVLAPISETLKQTRAALAKEGFSNTALIGFSGSPWTLACYMVEGGANRDFIHIKRWAYEDPEGFADLIDLLVGAVTDYCLQQIAAGAEIIQLFDSWAGVIDHTLFTRWVIQPTARIVEALRKSAPDVPVIGFPRGCGRMALDYAQNAKVTAMSVDQQNAPKFIAKTLQTMLPVQGNLDPVCLLAGGVALQNAAEDILTHLNRGPFVFNLGHGVIKETPPDHVAQLVEMVRGWS